jgi:hypothetical protein
VTPAPLLVERTRLLEPEPPPDDMLRCPKRAAPPAAAYTDPSLVAASRYIAGELAKDDECRDKLEANAAFHAARKRAREGRGK